MKKRHTAEQIVAKPRQADLEFGKGLRVPEVCKRLGISEQTYYRWRTKYGGMDPQIARQRVVRLFQDDHVGQPVPRALGAMIGDASGMPMQGMHNLFATGLSWGFSVACYLDKEVPA